MILLLLLILLLGVIKFWYLAVGALGLYVAWLWLCRLQAARAREDLDRLRHARARREIDEIAFATARAMHEAAAQGHGEVIEGTAVEEAPR